jgi:heme-degrading monooxygenase HmoA
MWARFGVIQVKPGQMDEFIQIFRDSMVPPARAQKGFQGVMVLADRDTNRAIGLSLWESEADARAVEASQGSFGSQIDKVAAVITEAPNVEYLEVIYQE